MAPLGTNWKKPHLTDAPHLIIAFKVDQDPQSSSYPDSSLLVPRYDLSLVSAAMAAGVLLAAIHHAGLYALTHTPSPMVFLRDYLQRPKNEMPFLVIPVGYPTEDCHVPDIGKKPLSELLVEFL